jgi:lipoprotein NlpD
MAGKKTLFKAPVSKKNSNKPLSLRHAESYRVKKGDTLYAIAWKAGLDVKTLAKRNNLKSPYIIYEDQKLNLKETKQSQYRQPAKTIAKDKPALQKIDKKLLKRCMDQECTKKGG